MLADTNKVSIEIEKDLSNFFVFVFRSGLVEVAWRGVVKAEEPRAASWRGDERALLRAKFSNY